MVAVRSTLHIIGRKMVPRAARIEIRRCLRATTWLAETGGIARRRAMPGEAERFEIEVACHRSPLQRPGGGGTPLLQTGKVRNVTIGAALINDLVIEPGQIFSYHRVVGRPTRRRGFMLGLELHDGELSSGVGGGLCQVSNMLYLLAITGGLTIVERHRHTYDLFPDHQRTVPFGCGATVFYNYRDLRFRNPYDFPLSLRLEVRDHHLVGGLWSTHEPGHAVEIYESEHRFFQECHRWMRENRIRRRFVAREGQVLRDEEVSHNLAEVMYEPC